MLGLFIVIVFLLITELVVFYNMFYPHRCNKYTFINYMLGLFIVIVFLLITELVVFYNMFYPHPMSKHSPSGSCTGSSRETGSLCPIAFSANTRIKYCLPLLSWLNLNSSVSRSVWPAMVKLVVLVSAVSTT